MATRLPRIGKCSGFLRAVRPELFDAAFEAELATAYKTPRGMRPLPPALLAMGTVLQADEQGGEADAVLTATMDQRGQLVLGTLGQEAAPFSPGALVAFRARLITQNLDRGLGSRTVAWARHTGKFGWQPLQAALDSWPLLGAGRGEDPWNWLGRAMHQLVV